MIRAETSISPSAKAQVLHEVVEKVSALIVPRNVVLIGATDRPGSWGARVFKNLTRYPFAGDIFLVNPGRSEVFGRKCYPSVNDLPQPPDQLIVLVPAPAVAAVLEAGAAAGARSATVFSAGFGEALDEAGNVHRDALLDVLARTGLAISGPNCMGNVMGPNALVSLTEERALDPRSGPVAIIGQSGGVVVYLNQSLEERGIKAGYLITSGNELGLAAADYIIYFSTVAEVKVIVIYLEAIRDVDRLTLAANEARANGKHIVAIKLGGSEAGRAAALAHTGSIAGDMAAFDAYCESVGIIRVETLDDAAEVVELLVHTGAPSGTRIGAITLSGAFRGLLIDAGGREGVSFPTLGQPTIAALETLTGVGSMIGNPIDGGFGVLTKPETYLASIDALQNDPNIDMILIQEALPREPGSLRAERYIQMVETYAATKPCKPIAFITLASHGQTEYSRALRRQAPHVSFLQEANKSLRAIANAVSARTKGAISAPPSLDARQKQLVTLFDNATQAGERQVALNENLSKSILAGWNIVSPREKVLATLEDALRFAEEITYPVVLKIVASRIPHKSDVGGVALNLRTPAELESAWTTMRQKLEAQGLLSEVEGMLIAKHVSGGLELVLGVHRDPEVGHVVMVGLGGIWIELFKDVSFARPPITREIAKEMLSRTHVDALFDGYRGGAFYDREPLLQALIGLSAFVEHCGDRIEAIDINPYVVLPEGQGGYALDALIVAHPKKV